MEMADWIPIEDILRVIERAKAGEWEWWRNSNCKYIGIRVDMRDGHCFLTNRDKQPITLAELEHQILLKDEEVPHHG
jgi:hypothetical protein